MYDKDINLHNQVHATDDGSANSLNRVQVIHGWVQWAADGESCKSQNGEEEEAQT